MTELEIEFNNLRVAWIYLVVQRNTALFMKYSRVLWYFCDLHYHFQEAFDLFNYAIQSLRETPVVDAQRNLAFGLLLGLQAWSDIDGSEKKLILIEEGLAVLEHYPNSKSFLIVLNNWCAMNNITRVSPVEIAKLKQNAQRARDLARRLNDRWEESRSSFFLAIALFGERKWRDAQDTNESALNIASELGESWQLGWMNLLSADISLELNDYAASQQYVGQGLRCFEAIHHKGGISACLMKLGDIRLRMRDYNDALKYFGQSLKMRKEQGYPIWTLMENISRFVELYLTRNHRGKALELLAFIRRYEPNEYWFEKQRAVLELELPSDIYAAAVERGKALDLDTVVAELLAEPPLFTSNE